MGRSIKFGNSIFGNSNNTGLGDLFGGFSFIGINACSSKDLDWYCQFSRFFSVIIMVIVLLAIFAVIYNFSKEYLFKKNK
jgi:hypothetical protein